MAPFLPIATPLALAAALCLTRSEMFGDAFLSLAALLFLRQEPPRDAAADGSASSSVAGGDNHDDGFLQQPLPPSSSPSTLSAAGGAAAVAAKKLRSDVSNLLDVDPGLAGPLLRLAFHDAATFEQEQAPPISIGLVAVKAANGGGGSGSSGNAAVVTSTGGPNGSVRYELDWKENRAIGKPLDVVTSLWATFASEDSNRGAVGVTTTALSLADAIALCGSEAVRHAGGPEIPIKLGREDANVADPEFLRNPSLDGATWRSKVDRTLPSPALDSDGLRLYFRRLGLSDPEFVALSGAHGLGRHVSLLGMPKPCLKKLTRSCLEDAPVALPFVASGADMFDNSYFQYLLRWYDRDVEVGDVAFIPTDVALVVDGGLRRHVRRFAADKDLYFRTFTRAYQRLVDTTATTIDRY